MPPTLIGFILLVAVRSIDAVGEPSDVAPSDYAPGSRIYQLANFALSNLKTFCATSNSYDCTKMPTSTSLSSVRSAQTQVVAGKNYFIKADTSAGLLDLSIYEKSWTNTLEITEAKLTEPSAGFSFAIMQWSLIDSASPLAMDAAQFEASLSVPAHLCTGGKVWNDCGSPCEKTCNEQAPMCILSCAAKCECPQDKPIWQDGSCIAAAECPCVPHVGICPRNYDPVCANGTTYSNKCEAEAACFKTVDTTVGECSTPPSTSMPGGFLPADDISAGSTIHQLAQFSVESLKTHCAASNSLACAQLPDASFVSVNSAQTQVVAGVNYIIDAKTSAGDLVLKIYEQSWTGTLQITEAKLTADGETYDLHLTPPLSMDADAFSALTAAAAGAPNSAFTSILIGGAPVGGASHGGHYTGSDTNLLASTPSASQSPSSPPAPLLIEPLLPEKGNDTQWWVLALALVGVVLVFLLAFVAHKHSASLRLPPEHKPDVYLRQGSVIGESKQGHMVDLVTMAKSDDSVA